MYIVDRNVEQCSYFVGEFGDFSKWQIHSHLTWLSNSTCRYGLKRIENMSKKTWTWMFLAMLFITIKTWKLSKKVISWWTDKSVWRIYTIEYYFSIKWSKILICTTIWVDLESLPLSERSQSQKTTHDMNPFIWDA